MDSSQAPLISNAQHQHLDEEELDYDVESESPVVDAGKAADAGPSTFVIVLTFAAGISGLLFGYDTGVVSAMLVSIGTSLSDRNLTSMDKSIITSATSLFALFLSPFSSVLADRFGRKRVILLADLLFTVGALLQAWSSTVSGMVIGRCIIGAGVGAASFVVPLYISEVAPASHRGRLVTTNSMFITGGQVVAYVVGWAFATFGSKETGWRWMVGLGALPAMMQAVMIFFMPETPRWLVKVGQAGVAKTVIQKINGDASMHNADLVVKEIELEVREEYEAQRLREHQTSSRLKWLGQWHNLISVGKHRRALAIACLLQGFQQLCGFNSLMYFSATIFTIVGFSNPTLTSMVVAVTNFLFTLAALVLIDRIGRRRILLYSIPFMIAGLLLSAYGFSFLSIGQSSEVSEANPPTGNSGHEVAGITVLVSIMVYVASYAIGMGNVPWMQSELFPLAVRSLGSGVSTATNWGANFVVGLTFLPMMDLLTPSWTFVLYAIVCVVGYFLVWRIYPETSGLSLEEATALLENGWGVR
ncbi:general substrate transporter [Thelonectria olida]|uniref:General substrate transporter n=1 Tax=Thelonectria olida TaxID=1576542 RepID=A0A9P9AUL2_9HYPO|nr:general substrate transporter [Thelonectria olida]